ncbi:hypothetical protein DYY67_1430 [Candidatus Nitrosotalea sp. TS]|nr:hypothetical protein [Candidatus Nitrosotalea sp. TS]
MYTGRINIEARDQNNNLISGATYAISPNPNGGNTPLTVIDGGTNDNDGINNGRSVVASVPFGSYTVTMTGTPSGYNVLGNSTSYTVGNTQIDGTAVFRLISTSTSLSTLGTTVITTQPSLNSTTLDTWQSSFNAIKINGTNSNAISTFQSLPPIISAGINNASAVNTAVSSQATVQLQTSFASATNGTTVINTIGAPVYHMPQSSDVVAVVPSIVATTNPATVSSETVSTPPLDSIVPGQKMIIPVSQLAIPATGGIKQLNVQSASSVSSVGNPTNWFVIHVDNTLSTSLPALPQSDKLALYIQVMYPYEETGQGFNWGNPSNFATPPHMTLQLPKNPPGVTVDSNGCPSSNIYIFDTVHNSWTTSGVTVLSAVPTVGNSNACDVTVQMPHFSQFALGGRSTSLGGGSSSVSSSPGGSGGGAVGTGPGGIGAGEGAGSGGSEGFGGILLPQLKIEEVSYDICKNNTADHSCWNRL